MKHSFTSHLPDSHFSFSPPEAQEDSRKKRSQMLRRRYDWLGRRLCSCGCPQLVPKGRHNWASGECYDRANPSAMRFRVQERDKGVCAKCGIDTIRLRARARKWKHLYRSDLDSNNIRFWTKNGGWTFDRELWERANRIYQKWRQKLYRAAENRRNRLALAGWDLTRETWWDSDHILAVWEGGGLCPLSNYQTLCLLCHKAKTKEDAARRAKERREKKKLAL